MNVIWAIAGLIAALSLLGLLLWVVFRKKSEKYIDAIREAKEAEVHAGEVVEVLESQIEEQSTIDTARDKLDAEEVKAAVDAVADTDPELITTKEGAIGTKLPKSEFDEELGL